MSTNLSGKYREITYCLENQVNYTYVLCEWICPHSTKKVTQTYHWENYHSPKHIHDYYFPVKCKCGTTHKITFQVDSNTSVHWKSTRNEQKRFEILVHPFCDTCGQPLTSSYRHCYKCNKGEPTYFDELRTLTKYRKWETNSHLFKTIRILKNEYGKLKLRQVEKQTVNLGQLLFWGLKNLYPHFQKADFLIPLPAHRNKIKKRGFNQTDVLANYLKNSLNIPVLSNLVIKIRDTPSQRGLTEDERQLNVFKCFQINNTLLGENMKPYENALRQYKDKTFLLIDDIISTGTTVNECSRILRQLNPQCIYVYGIARNVLKNQDSQHNEIRHLKDI